MAEYKVGDWWRTRTGRHVQIIRVNPSKEVKYPVRSSDGIQYTLEGEYYEGEQRDLDLVQKMKSPVWEEDNTIDHPHLIAEHWEHELDGNDYLILKIHEGGYASVERVDQVGTRKGPDFRMILDLILLTKKVKFEVVCSTKRVYV